MSSVTDTPGRHAPEVYVDSGLERYYPPRCEPAESPPPRGIKSAYPTYNQQVPNTPAYKMGTKGADPGSPGFHETKPKHGKICGLEISRFWLVVAVSATLVVIAVLAGLLGAVMSGGIKTTSNSNATSSGSSNQSGTASTTTATPTIVNTKGPGGVTLECPSADRVNYTAPGTNKTFLRLCYHDLPGGDKFNVTANSMEECINTCANLQDCVAVTWDFQGEQGTGNNYCWVKAFASVKSTGASSESAILWQ